MMKRLLCIIIVVALVSASLHLDEFNNRPIGDVNQDGLVNILDIVLTVDLILNNANYDSNADLNNDQILNVIDIVELVNIIIDVPTIPDNAYGTPETLDILTWNIEHFPKNNNTVDTLSSILSNLYVDIVALQEIESTASLVDVAEQLGDNWVAYRAESNSSWGELSYLINTDNVDVLQAPYTILNQYQYEFAWRPPYVLKISYNGIHYTLINIHYKCCDGSEDRRLDSSIYLDQYISTNLSNEKVILLGDFNDLLVDSYNVFQPFLDNPSEYYFADYYIAEDPSMIPYWSFPSWPSHLDHILITNEIFDIEYDATTVLVDQIFFNSFNNYDNLISDHRPVGIRLSN
tara:strand:+ start:9236 stop:10276 length:1041 start_codon:yes stop_codon:yes gene_type:complete